MPQALSKRTWLGVAREATNGTAIATPTIYMPSKSLLKNKQPKVYVDDERGTLDKNYTSVPVIRRCDGEVKGEWYNDVHPYLFCNIFGAPVTTTPDNANAPTMRKHTFTLQDIPPTLTLFKSYDSVIYYSAYQAVEKFTLKFSGDGKLLESDSSTKGLWMVPYGGAYGATYSSVHPFAGYMPIIQLAAVGGSLANTSDILEFDLEFNRKIELWYPPNGSPDFITLYMGEREVKCNFTARFDTSTNYDFFRAGTDLQMTIDVKGDSIASSGPAYYQELFISLPIVTVDEADHDTGKTNILVKFKGTAKPGTTANSLWSAWVQNTVTSYTV